MSGVDKRTLSQILAVAALGFALVVAALAWASVDAKERGLTAAQDTIETVQGWRMVEESRRPASVFRTGCNYGATPCPSARLVFERPTPTMRPDELMQVVPGAAWTVIDDRCHAPNNCSSTNAPPCQVRTLSGDFTIEVMAVSDVEFGKLYPPHQVIVIIEPSR